MRRVQSRIMLLLLLLLLLLLCAVAAAMPWSAGSALGEPLTAEQLQHRVDSAIASRAASVDVPGGDYLFNHSGGTDFSVLGASGLRIRALGRVTLWFAGSAGVNITDSTDVQLVGDGSTGAWTLDYDPPPTKQELAGSTLNLLNCTRVVAEDVTIRAAPYMAVTAWNGGGAHVFRRLTFGPPKTGATRGLVGLRDAMHFSDQRIGPTVVDSVIGFTGDDFFNIHTTLMLVLSCETSSCYIINPHLFSIPRNTAYGTNSVMGTVVPGDAMSFYRWPETDMVPHRHGQEPLRVVSTEAVRDPKLLGEAAKLVPMLEGAPSLIGESLSGWTQFTNRTVGWNADELWKVTFSSSVPIAVGPTAIVTIDTISNVGARIIDTRFINTTCNLGRLKSSNALVRGCTFENARIPNLEITYLPQFFEGPIDIRNVTLVNNTIAGDGPQPIHCGPLCEMAGCQDLRGPRGTWERHSCPACRSCEVDTPWTTDITLLNNTIVP